MELQAQVIYKMRTKRSGLAEFAGISAAMEGAGYVCEARAADNSVGVGVGKVVKVHAKKGIVPVIDMVVQAQEPKPAAIMPNEATGRQGRCDR